MKLTNENIMQTAEEMGRFCHKHKVAGRQCKKISLEIEEILLNFQSHFGEETEYDVFMKSYFGFPLLRIMLKGESFDPLSLNVDDEYNEIMRSMIMPEESKPTWRYINGVNRITISVTRRIKRSALFSGSLLPSLIAAILFALICKATPPALETFMLEDLLTPVFSAMMNLLVLVTGPVIFLSLLTGIIASDNISSLKKTGGNIINRFIILTLLCIVSSILVCRFVFPWEGGGSAAFDFGELLTLVLSFVPKSIISPFADNNLLQIVFMSLLSGVVLIMLGDRVRAVKELIEQLNAFVLRLMNTVSAVIPVLIFVSVAKTILESDLSEIASVMKLVVSEYVVVIVLSLLLVLYLFLRRRVKPRQFWKKVKPVITVAFSTGSSTATMEPNLKACEDMGVKDDLTKLWLPLSYAMFSPSTVIPLIFGIFFVAQLYNVTVSFTWLVTLIILIFQFGFASAKVPGGVIAVFSILFVQLGIPSDGIGLLAAANALVLNITTAYGMVVREFDIVDLAIATDNMDMEKFNS